MARDPRTVCYVGTIEPIRGIFEMIQALEHVDARLVLAGPWDRPETEARARALPGWAKVSYRGKVTRDEAWRIMAGASLGFVVLHPAPNHIEAQPTKMFEYMAAGLPVIASHFPLWSRIVRDSGAGVCVDPKDPVALGRAIAQMLADPASLREMGRRGREAVATRYRWAPEGEKLCRLYAELVGAGQGAPVAAAKPLK
jgi:glycosyltransferase involved in cell wall biosynthesis